MEDPNEMQTQTQTAAEPATNEPLSNEVEQNLAAEAAASIPTEVAAPAEAATEETTPAAEAPAEATTPAAEAPAAEAPAAEAPAAEAPAAEATTPAAEAPAAEATSPQAPAEAETEEEQEPTVDYSGMSREELFEAFKALLDEGIDKIRNRASQIRATFNTANKEVQKQAFEAYLADGGEKENYEQHDDSLSEAFHKLYNEYRQRRQQHLEAIEAQKMKNLEQKRGLLEELRQIIDSDEPSLKKMHDDFNAVQERWKAIGDVPRAEMNDLWQNYHFMVEQFFNKVRINKELKNLDLKKNLEQKIQLCEKAEELIGEPSVTKAFKGLQNLRDQWKNIGPVPTEQNDEIWSRFCNASDQISTRHREFFEQRREEQEKNLLAKQALLDKATELAAMSPNSTKGWNDISAQMDELLKIWKTIGPVPHEQNELIWKNFKGTINSFYTHKREFFDTRKDEQTESYNKKVDLCQKAEAIAQRDDWRKATQEMLELQAEWRQTGPLPRKMSENLWQRFRGACDIFFAKKNDFFANLRGSEQENLQQKEALIAQLREHQFGDDKEENLDVIKDYQRRWMDIGHVPMSEKERVQKEFRGLINGYFEKLKISAREAEENSFRERIRNAAGDMKFANNERTSLQDKIEKLRSDLQLWENNLGFLASSKQADLLKAEFEKKMQGARQQIALLEAKLRILRETENQPKAEKPAEAPAEAPAETPANNE